MKRSKYEAKMKALQDEIEALKKVEIEEDSGRWKPEIDSHYYMIRSDGLVVVVPHKWNDSNYDNGCYAIGNCFKTWKEAEFARERLKVLAELKEFAEPRDAEWTYDQLHYFISYNYYTYSIHISFNRQFKAPLPILYFESAKDAQEAIDKVGEERVKKYYLGVVE